MQFQVKFSQFKGYWVAEAGNGAVSHGVTIDECRENIRDAIKELVDYEKTENPKLAEKTEVLEVAI